MARLSSLVMAELETIADCISELRAIQGCVAAHPVDGAVLELLHEVDILRSALRAAIEADRERRRASIHSPSYRRTVEANSRAEWVLAQHEMGRTYRDIGRELGLSTSTVGSLILKARRRRRERMRETGSHS